MLYSYKISEVEFCFRYQARKGKEPICWAQVTRIADIMLSVNFYVSV
jgi:hypothetical protein